MTKKAKYPIRTIETMLSILEELDELGVAGVTELANRIGIAKSAVHNHLNTLQEHGYVNKEGDKYRLGLKFLDLGARARGQNKLYRIAKPTIEKLEIETKGMFRLLIEEHGMGVILYQSERSQMIAGNSHIGQRTYLHTTADGKAILASLPRERVKQVIEHYGLPASTRNTITDNDALFEELERTREQGYATEEEEWLLGVRSIGTAIVDENETVLGAISVVKPLTEADTAISSLQEEKKIIQRAAETIQTDFEYSWYKPNKFIKMKHR